MARIVCSIMPSTVQLYSYNIMFHLICLYAENMAGNDVLSQCDTISIKNTCRHHPWCMTCRDYYTIHGVCSIRVVIFKIHDSVFCTCVVWPKSQIHRKLMCLSYLCKMKISKYQIPETSY